MTMTDDERRRHRAHVLEEATDDDDGALEEEGLSLENGEAAFVERSLAERGLTADERERIAQSRELGQEPTIRDRGEVPRERQEYQDDVKAAGIEGTTSDDRRSRAQDRRTAAERELDETLGLIERKARQKQLEREREDDDWQMPGFRGRW